MGDDHTTFDASATAVVITDPQNGFLSPDGAAWDLVEARSPTTAPSATSSGS
jgi:hypothetical protein